MGENVLNLTFDITVDGQPRRATWRAFLVCKIMDGWTYIAFRPVEDLANASIVFPYTLFIEKAAEIAVTHCGLNAEKTMNLYIDDIEAGAEFSCPNCGINKLRYEIKTLKLIRKNN